MMATVADLVSVRSQQAQSIASYYEALIDKLDRTPWYRSTEVIRLSSIVIPVRVLKEETRSPGDFAAGMKAEKDREAPLSRHKVDPEIAALYEEPIKRRKEAAWELERENIRRAVVLGPPGGGKTFLTQATGLDRAHEGLRNLKNRSRPLHELPCPVCLDSEDLPQVELSLAETNTFQAEVPGVDDLAESLLRLVTRKYGFSPRFEPWFRERLSSPDFWLILDALDQVKPAQLSCLTAWLVAIDSKLKSKKWNCRVLLTCRAGNYDRGMIPWTSLTEYELSPLQFRDIGDLIGRWYGAGDLRGEKLKATMSGTYSLEHACRTPLIATLACLANEKRPLTEETSRRELYHGVLRGLLGKVWKNDSRPSRVYVSDILDLLRPVAWKLFADLPGGSRFSNSLLKEAIMGANALGNVPGTPAEIRDDLRDCGVLIEAGESENGETQLSFLHRTFLEYLAAEHLTRAVLEHGWKDATVECKENRVRVSILVAKKAWLNGRVGDERLLDRLLAGLQTDDLWMRDLFVHRLGELGTEAARHPEVVLALLKSLRQDSEIRVRSSAAWALEELGVEAASHPEVVPTLLQALRGDPDGSVRMDAARALGAVGVESARFPDVVPALLEAIRDDPDGDVVFAAEALKVLGGVRYPEVVPTLLQAISGDSDEDVRCRALEVLRILRPEAARHPEVVRALLETIRNGPDGYVHILAGYALRSMGVDAANHPEVSSALAAVGAELLSNYRASTHPEEMPLQLQSLRDDPNPEVRARAASALWQLVGNAEDYPEIVPALLRALRDDPSVGVRVFALEALGPEAACLPEVFPALLQVLREDTDEEVRELAARALRPEATRHPEIVPTLLQVLGEDSWEPVRWEAAHMLLAMNQASALVATTLIRGLDLSGNASYHAAEIGHLMSQGWRIFKARGDSYQAIKTTDLAQLPPPDPSGIIGV